MIELFLIVFRDYRFVKTFARIQGNKKPEDVVVEKGGMKKYKHNTLRKEESNYI